VSVKQQIPDRSDQPRAAYLAAIRLLTRRDYSSAELTQRLLRKGHHADDIDAALTTLQQQGYQDERRAAVCYYQNGIRLGHGPHRIRQALQTKGLSDSLIEALFAEDNTDWYSQADTVRRKRFGSTLPADPKSRAQQQRFLYQRGFDADMIRQLINDLGI